MNVSVLGLWHLGSVMAACLAEAGHSVTGFEPDAVAVEALASGQPPVAEPGLAALLARGLAAGRLRFVADPAEALRSAEVVCVAFDTPVNDDDLADVDQVIRQVEAIFPFLPHGVLVLSSSQLPVGTLRRLELAWAAVAAGRRATFACSPENLRLGKAIEVFMKPDRVIVGVRDAWSRERVAALFAPITDRLEWMSVESAEMTKHAINGFLATSVTFINEIAALCERVGADAKDVERGLKTERRIGPQAYLSPGSAFAGGTLARDVTFLRALGRDHDTATPLMDGVLTSNTAHRQWARRCLAAELGSLTARRVAIWGLTYKPGTDTLRRSSAVELCAWLLENGADVQVHDPGAGELPVSLARATRHADPLAAAAGAAALVVATEWPVYRTVDHSALAAAMSGALVLDPNRFLGATIGSDARFRTISVGRRLA